MFIPTASNVEKGDKSWLIDDLMNLKKQGFKSIEIADISAVDEKYGSQNLKRLISFILKEAIHITLWNG